MSEETDRALGATRDTPYQEEATASDDQSQAGNNKYPALSGLVVLLKIAAGIVLVAGLFIGANRADSTYGDPSLEVFIVPALSGALAAVLI